MVSYAPYEYGTIIRTINVWLAIYHMCICVWYKYAYGTEHPHDIWNQLHNNLEKIAVSLHTNFINSHCTDHLDFKTMLGFIVI